MEWMFRLSKLLTIVLSVLYFYQILYLVLPFLKKARPHRETVLRRYAILIAARNEEAVLPYLLDSIRAQDYPPELITTYVVADNCTDRTAALASRHGAVVYPRHNQTRIGKGYALNYLLEKIRESGAHYDAYLVFDADNLLTPGYVRAMNRTCSDGYEAFTGYRNSKNFGDSWVSAGYALWFLHDSVHLNRARSLLGTTCAVSGTGFGFTQGLLERIGGWHFFTLTEDVEFDTWCATHGVRIGFCGDAALYDEQPVTFAQSWRQRTRWVQGGFQIAGRYSGDLFRGILRGGKIGYASFEATTISVWGFAFSALVALFSYVASYFAGGWPAVLTALRACLLGSYGTMFVIGLLTELTEWRRIRATTEQKLLGLFSFPLFMLTYVPIAAAAAFQKFQWKPIAHTAAVPVSRMASGEP